ncbi:Protein CBG26434 [Caenorhabditis briggsae]|uniref:Protein CBG26434 n=1 Tax=Caenorhabditis briggsae TaxID=6238 RepID=B6IEX1_CAEBR|nr:Protein CBG26434 [Caenorhabditis briggsae]CAR98451.1 Protein CBG26434 [Caenorhabditis briggsae]
MLFMIQLTLLMVLSVMFLLCGTNSQTKQATTNNKSKISVAKTKKSKKKSKKVKEEGETSQKSYPAFVMPTKSEMKRIKSAEGKKKGTKDGFYQEKSDEDDTLEKVESLHLEMSDKTRRAAKKKAKKNV